MTIRDVLMPLLLFLMVLACGAGLLRWRHLHRTYWRWFPVYLGFIVGIELAGWHFDGTLWNPIIYNYIGIPAQFFFFYWLFYRAFYRHRYRCLPALAAVVYLCCLGVDIFFIRSHKYEFFSLSYLVANLLLLVLTLRYFSLLVRSDEILHFRQSRLFWVSTGLLLYYLGSFPYFGLRNTMGSRYPDLYMAYYYVTMVLNCLMYLMFTFSFIWGRTPRRASSLS